MRILPTVAAHDVVHRLGLSRVNRVLHLAGLELVDDRPRCTECGEPAAVQVTELLRADLNLKLPGGQPRCHAHGQVLAVT